jgi:hypothetical protein
MIWIPFCGCLNRLKNRRSSRTSYTLLKGEDNESDFELLNKENMNPGSGAAET